MPNSIMDQPVEVLGDIPEDPYEDALRREELRSKLDDGFVPKKGRYSYAGKYVKSQSPNQKGAILNRAKDKVKEFARERYQEASDDEVSLPPPRRKRRTVVSSSSSNTE